MQSTGYSDYPSWVCAVKNCHGGCRRKGVLPNPLFRPKGGYKIPSDLLIVLEQPNTVDDRGNKCLTIFSKECVHRRPDKTAEALSEFLTILGFCYKKFYLTNSLLCWQPDNKNKDKMWKECWLPCLSHGWLRDLIFICSPKLIVTFGAKALHSVWHVLEYKSGQLLSDPSMTDEINNPGRISGMHVCPLSHVSRNAQRTRPLDDQRKDWMKLREYCKDLDLSLNCDTAKFIL